MRALGLLAGLLALVLHSAPGAAQGELRQRLNEASRLRVEGRYAEAVRAYEGLLPQCATDGERTQVWFGLAAVYRTLGDSAGAIKAYTEITRLPDAPTPYRVSAGRQLASLYTDARQPAEARTAWERLGRDFPDNADAVAEAAMALARLDLAGKQVPAAVARLRQFLKDHPDSPYAADAWGLLAQAQLAGGDTQGAVGTAREAWRQFPDRTEIVTGLVYALLDRGQAGPARALAQDIFAAHPDDPQLFRLLVDVHRGGQTLPQLLRWLEQQAAAAPTTPGWLEQLAQLCREEGRLAEAVSAYERLLKLRPTAGEVLRAAGEAALAAEDMDRAERWLQQALALNPEDPNLVTMIGQVYLKQGRPAEALALWKRGFGYRTTDPTSVLRLGGTLQRAGLSREALAIYKEARQAAGDDRQYALQVGEAREMLLDFGAATREYLTAMRATPREAQSAGYRLQNLIEDAAARPEVLGALEKEGPLEKLPAEAQGVLLYGQVLDGRDVAAVAAALPRLSHSPSQLRLLNSLAERLEEGGHDAAAVVVYRALSAAVAEGVQRTALGGHIAELQARSGDWRGALETLSAPPPAGTPPELVAELQVQRADLLLRTARRPAEAEALYHGFAAQPAAGQTLRARWGLADCAFARGDYPAARTAYANLAQAPPPSSDGAASPQVFLSGFAGQWRQPWRPPGADYVAYREAEMLFREGQYAKAREAFQGLSGRYPASPYANDALERLLLIPALTARPAGEEAYREALQAFERGGGKLAAELLGAIDASPVAEPAWLLRAQVQDWQGDRSAAVQTLTELPRKFPDSPYAAEAWLQSAAWQAEENPAAARQQLQALLQRYPDAPAAEEAKVLLQALSRPAKERTP